ncbi:MAG TPA: hypothetical protein VIH47_05965 [Solirubrobacterales bacterium]
MNNNVFTGQVASEVQMWGMPGRERADFWFAERSGREPLKLAVQAYLPYVVKVAQSLEDGDVIAMAGFLRSRRGRCEERHYHYWFEARIIEPLFPRDGQRKGWDG